MAALTAEVLLERAKRGFDERDLNRSLYEDCYEFMLPYRNSFVNGGSKTSQNKPSRQYDSTAMIAGANFVNTMQANFFPVFTRWAELKAGPAVPEKQRAALNKVLSKMTDVVFAYLNASNFATSVAEMTFDWGVGTGALWLFDGDENQPLNFIAAPASQMGLVEGRFGTVDSRFRQHKVKARLIKTMWPKDDVKLNTDLENLIRDKPDEEVELIESLYYDYESLAWYYEVLHEPSKFKLIEGKQYAEEICFTPRWMKIPGKAWGVGPFVLALLDVKTLNKLKEYMLRSAAMNIFGVYTVASGTAFNANSATLQPGSFIPVERNAGPNGPSIAALPRTGDFQLQEFMVNDLQDAVRKTMLDTKLPADTPQPKTAFEIAQRIKEFQVDIGSAYGRAMFELVQPLFKRIVAILARRGIIDLPEGFSIDNLFVKVQIVSPIAQSQAMEDVQKLMQAMGMVGNINPALVLTAWEVEKIPQWLTEKTGSPAELLRDEADAKMLQEQVAKMVAQMTQAQMAPQQQGQGQPANATA